MMNSKKMLVFWSLVAHSVLAPVAPAQEEKQETIFLERNQRQTAFVRAYVEQNKPKSPPKSAEEVDSYFAGAVGAWAEKTQGEDPLMGRLNGYAMLGLFENAYHLTGSEPTEQIRCHVYAKYAMPAWLADHQRYSTVASAHAPLIFWGLEVAGGALALQCELETTDWVRLQSALERGPSIYQKYLDTEAYPNKNIARRIRWALQVTSKNAPLYAVRGALYRGSLDEAFAGLAAATIQGHEVTHIRPLGDHLWRAYAAAKKADWALAVLDLMARSLTAADLPHHTLRAMYAEAEPQRGPKRFDLIKATRPAPLVASEVRADFSGVYTDLLTQQPVDLAKFSGKLIFLDFWATWCGPCIAEFPTLRAFSKEYGNRITFLSINSDDEAQGRAGVRAFMTEHGIDFPVLYDEPSRSLAARFEVYGFPAKVMISPEGMVLMHPTDGRRIVSLDDVKAYLDQDAPFPTE